MGFLQASQNSFPPKLKLRSCMGQQIVIEIQGPLFLQNTKEKNILSSCFSNTSHAQLIISMEVTARHKITPSSAHCDMTLNPSIQVCHSRVNRPHSHQLLHRTRCRFTSNPPQLGKAPGMRSKGMRGSPNGVPNFRARLSTRAGQPQSGGRKSLESELAWKSHPSPQVPMGSGV